MVWLNLANVTGHFGGNLGNYTVCLIVQSRNNRIPWIADWRFLINELFLTIEIGIIDGVRDAAQNKRTSKAYRATCSSDISYTFAHGKSRRASLPAAFSSRLRGIRKHSIDVSLSARLVHREIGNGCENFNRKSPWTWNLPFPRFSFAWRTSNVFRSRVLVDRVFWLNFPVPIVTIISRHVYRGNILWNSKEVYSTKANEKLE